MRRGSPGITGVLMQPAPAGFPGGGALVPLYANLSSMLPERPQALDPDFRAGCLTCRCGLGAGRARAARDGGRPSLPNLPQLRAPADWAQLQAGVRGVRVLHELRGLLLGHFPNLCGVFEWSARVERPSLRRADRRVARCSPVGEDCGGRARQSEYPARRRR